MSNPHPHITPCERDSSRRIGDLACALARLVREDGS
jgi:hypothetical protein